MVIMTCVSCGLGQLALYSDLCRRCCARRGSSIFEIFLINKRVASEWQNQLHFPIGSSLRLMPLRQGRTAFQLALPPSYAVT